MRNDNGRRRRRLEWAAKPAPKLEPFNARAYEHPIGRPDIKNPPRQAPIRILVCVWWLSTIVIVNIYLGILFGQLVVPRRPPSIESLEELVAKEGQVEWCVTKGSAIYELFRQSKGDSVYGQLSRRMRTVASADEGVLRVVNSSWAYIRERSILAFKVSLQCTVYSVKGIWSLVAATATVWLARSWS